MYLYFVSNTFLFKPTSHLSGFNGVFLSPQKWEAYCLFCVTELMTTLVSSYYGRQSIAKLTAEPYFMIITWLLIALNFVTYGPVSMKLINDFKIGGTDLS